MAARNEAVYLIIGFNSKILYSILLSVSIYFYCGIVSRDKIKITTSHQIGSKVVG